MKVKRFSEKKLHFAEMSANNKRKHSTRKKEGKWESWFIRFLSSGIVDICNANMSADPSLLQHFRGLSDDITHVAYHPKESQVRRESRR